MLRKVEKANGAAPPVSGTVATGGAILPRAKVRGGEITMSAACKLLDRKRSTVRKLIVGGKLKSEVRDGIHYMRRSEVARLAMELGAPSTRIHLSSSRGELAADAFDMLKHGATPIDIVIRLKLAPEEVEDLLQRFHKLGGEGTPRPCATPGCDAYARICGGCATTKPKPPPTVRVPREG